MEVLLHFPPWSACDQRRIEIVLYQTFYAAKEIECTINPAFILNTLYGIFLIHKEKFRNDSKIQSQNDREIQAQIENIFKKYFTITKGKEHRCGITKAIRNAIAHFDIRYDTESGNYYFTNEKEKTMFEAKIYFLDLRLVINELEKIL